MSVDTHVTGRNLAPYKRMTTGHGDLRILVSPQLVGLAQRMVVTTRGRFAKKLTVDLTGVEPRSGDCTI